MKYCHFLSLACLVLGGATAHAVDFSEVQNASSAQIAKMEADFENASERCRASYTVAVGADKGWSSFCHSKASPAELERIALQKCEYWAGGPCGIVVLRGEATPFRIRDIQTEYPTRFDASAVPFVRDSTRERLEAYESSNKPRALAITRNGRWAFVYGDTAAAAQAEAIRKCEEADRGRGRCFVYAVGEEVLFNRDTNLYPDRQSS